MSEHQIKTLVWEVAKEHATREPGWAQEGVVLREIRDRVPRLDLDVQQRILNAWHDLFAENKLGWGYDLDDPGAPFFHLRHVTRGEV
jgi:hypothetical protein